MLKRRVWLMTGPSAFEAVFTSIADAAVAADQLIIDYDVPGVNRWNPTLSDRHIGPRKEKYFVGRWVHDWGNQFTVGEQFFIRAVSLFPKGAVTDRNAAVYNPRLSEGEIASALIAIENAQRAAASP